MGYIDKNLVSGERIIYRAEISWAALLIPSTLSLLFLVILGLMIKNGAFYFFLFLIVFTILFLVIFRLVLTILTTDFVLTDRRIIAKKGVIRQHSLEILLGKIESISVSQSLDGRIFNFGTVSIIGSGGTEEYFPSISNPSELRRQVNIQVSKQ